MKRLAPGMPTPFSPPLLGLLFVPRRTGMSSRGLILGIRRLKTPVGIIAACISGAPRRGPQGRPGQALVRSGRTRSNGDGARSETTGGECRIVARYTHQAPRPAKQQGAHTCPGGLHDMLGGP